MKLFSQMFLTTLDDGFHSDQCPIAARDYVSSQPTGNVGTYSMQIKKPKFGIRSALGEH